MTILSWVEMTRAQLHSDYLEFISRITMTFNILIGNIRQDNTMDETCRALYVIGDCVVREIISRKK